MTTTRTRPTVVTATLLSTACLLLTACQGSATPAATASAPSASTAAVSASPVSAGGPAATPTASAAAPLPVDPVRCTPELLTAAAQSQPSNAATSTYDEDIKLTNTSGRSCALQGFPTVAYAGLGDPSHNRPLKVTPRGAAHTLRLAPGHSAWLRLSFRVVMGEADGYCASGATPTAAPTLIVGLRTGGGIQLASDGGGNFAECDDVVWASSFLTAHP